LAELTGIDVIADFRSRDIAAGGQSAPLVPAFHHAVFAVDNECRVVANIGGISNISILGADGSTAGFDTGPGNVLMDYWIHQHQGQKTMMPMVPGHRKGLNSALLEKLMAEPYLHLTPPKSTGRDLFHPAWLQQQLQGFDTVAAVDVQATLCAYTAMSLAHAICTYGQQVKPSMSAAAVRTIVD
jgi:anhydro-N-acetylmuramic acid kinase